MVTEGDGDRVKANQIAGISIVALSGKDGSTLEDTFPDAPQDLELNEALKTESPVIYNAFVGSKIGSHLALAVPGQAAAEGAEAQPTQLLVVKVISAKDAPKVLDKPEGETVTPPAGLPTVKENDKGVPEISVKGVAAPKALVSQDLIKGTGPEVKATDTLTVNYVGVALSSGKVFDSSFDRGEKTSPAHRRHQGLDPGPDRRDGRLPGPPGHSPGPCLRREGPGRGKGRPRLRRRHPRRQVATTPHHSSHARRSNHVIWTAQPRPPEAGN